MNILLTSVGRRVVLIDLFRQALQTLGIPGRVLATELSPLSSGFLSADEGILVPPCSHKDFIPKLLEICEQKQIKILVPTKDFDLPSIARHYDHFTAIGTRVIISSPEVIQIGAFKDQMHHWLIDNDLPTVEQMTVQEVVENPQKWSFPCIIKPCDGHGSTGLITVKNEHDLCFFSRGRGDFLAESIAPGKEYTIDALVNLKGELVCAVPRQRLEVRSGEISKGITVRSCTLSRLVHEFFTKLPGAYGPFNIQIFMEQDKQEPRIIEFNPRFGGGFPLSWHAGARYPQWIIEELLGLASTASDGRWRNGLVMLRYDDAIYIDQTDLPGNTDGSCLSCL